MSTSAARIRLNPGGALAPDQVVGRDSAVEQLWHVLDRQSVMLTAERRMGKTSLLKKLRAEGRPGTLPILRNVQDVTSPEEFVRRVLADVHKATPGTLSSGSLLERLRKAGVKTIGASSISVEFEPSSARSWKDILSETFAALDQAQDGRIVFLWDELPQMVASIAAAEGALVGREMLDALRAVRETSERTRMVFSGSLGLHHVVSDLRTSGGSWAPVNDMMLIDLPPLSEPDAMYLAEQLLRNEGVRCGDGSVAGTIVRQVDAVPFYVHLTVQALLDRQRAGHDEVAVADVFDAVDERLRDPLDQWQLLHYVDRLRAYYGEDADAVKAILDLLATSGPQDVSALSGRLGAHLTPPSENRLRELLDLLGKDHYLAFADGTVGFRLDLLRRALCAKRHLEP